MVLQIFWNSMCPVNLIYIQNTMDPIHTLYLRGLLTGDRHLSTASCMARLCSFASSSSKLASTEGENLCPCGPEP